MANRAFFIPANVTLAAVLLQAVALAQETRDGLSTADPAQEGFSVQRMGEMEKAYRTATSSKSPAFSQLAMEESFTNITSTMTASKP